MAHYDADGRGIQPITLTTGPNFRDHLFARGQLQGAELEGCGVLGDDPVQQGRRHLPLGSFLAVKLVAWLVVYP